MSEVRYTSENGWQLTVLLGASGVIFVSPLTARIRDFNRAVVFQERVMTTAVQVGTILIEGQSQMAQFHGLESEPYSGDWSLVRALDSFSLDRKMHSAGWNFFFMADEVTGMSFGALGAKSIQNALERILLKVKHQNFNSLEITGIVAKRFWGVPYAMVSAHSRHIQKSCFLNGTEARRTTKLDAAWAKG
jgi:hypothetical protein